MMPTASDENAIVRALSQPSTGNHFDQPAVPLPNELLRQIFRCVLGDLVVSVSHDEPAGTPGALSLRHTLRVNHFRAKLPFRLAAVCRKWRLVALETPELWAWLAFCGDPGWFLRLFHGAENSGVRIRIAEHLAPLLARARPAPLDLFIGEWSSGDGSLWPCEQILATPGVHWRMLCLEVPSAQNAAPVSALLSCRAPALEYLFVSSLGGGPRWNGDPTGRSLVGPFSLVLCSERLRHVEIRDCRLAEVTVAAPAMLPSLAYLCLDYVKLRPDALWHILDSAVNLQSLRMVDIIATAGQSWTPSTNSLLRLAHLKRLDVGTYGAVPMLFSQWSAHLQLPRLEFMETSDVGPPDLLALLPCVGPSLRYLCYDDGEDRDMLPVLAALPHLCTLELGPHFPIRRHSSTLFCAMAAGTILPELETLCFNRIQIHWSPGPDDDSRTCAAIRRQADEARSFAEALLSFVRARNLPGVRESAPGGSAAPELKLITFNNSVVDDTLVEDLEELVNVDI